MNRVPLT